MSKFAFPVRVVVVVLMTSVAAHAQVFNPVAPQPNPGVQPAGGPAATAPAGAVEQTGWGIPMPKITMPKITMPSMDQVTAPFKSGFSKVSAGSKKAMEGMKEMLSFGKKGTSTTTVNRNAPQKKQSFWKRLVTKETTPQVPQTVGEFMSQPRLDP